MGGKSILPRAMPYRDLEPFSKQLTIVIGLVVVGSMAFGLTVSFYRNVLFEGTLQNIQEQNRRLEEQIELSRHDLEYYRSAQYKDKYAKENFGLLNPGEKVLIITTQPSSTLSPSGDTLAPTEKQKAAFEELLRQIPTIEHWRMYLFHRDRIEALKRRL